MSLLSAHPGISAEFPTSVDVVLEVCGSPDVITDGISLLRPGGMYLLIGMVHPQSHLNITGEMIIRKCLTIKGKLVTALTDSP